MLTYYTATTLDGFIADPDDSLDWLLKQPQDLVERPPDETGPFGYQEFITDIGAIVMGSTTYEWAVEHLIGAAEPWPYPMPCWVMSSRTLPAVDGADLRFAAGDVVDVHRQMTDAAGGRGLWVVGGGDLAGQFADAGLLDEIVVAVAPVTLGAGRPLLPRRLDLELIESATDGPFTCARYRVVGPLASSV